MKSKLTKRLVSLGIASIGALVFMTGCSTDEPTEVTTPPSIEEEAVDETGVDDDVADETVEEESENPVSEEGSGENEQDIAQGMPEGMRKFMNYDGYRYAFMGDGEVYELTEDQLGDELGVVDEEATFAQGGKIYALKDYTIAFRVAIEYEGQYYIAENVATIDDTPIDITSYYENADLADKVVEVEIFDHMETELLATLEQEYAQVLLEIFTTTSVATLENEDYEAIGKAQLDGLSYKVDFVLTDETRVSHYIIPTMDYVTIGDYTCTVDGLGDEVSDFFEGLEQDTSTPVN